MTYESLSAEQKQFIDLALKGENILVDACIGSGKTTAIQILCACFGPSKRILYLTYNKLLKLDAQSKIRTRGTKTTVTNYHGFCYSELKRIGAKPSFSDCIQLYNQLDLPVRNYDVLILDEYQDIEQEIADMLWHIKEANPDIQIIAVGDMAQKIYDKTRLNAAVFISEFLGFKNYKAIEFTQCFRLPADLAQRLSKIWGKEIRGVNPNCTVEIMKLNDAVKVLAEHKPSEILCLGANTGIRNEILNRLEKKYPEKFNKDTVWSKISDCEGSTSPDEKSAIFTTYDGCKGMERDICVICDWTEDYCDTRVSRPQVRAEIIRNVFCVAASRGKRRIIFLQHDNFLSDETLCKLTGQTSRFEDVSISQMFDFKYVEDVEAAYKQLQIKEVSPKGEVINVPTTDGMIDLSPCIGIYQEVAYFDNCHISKYIDAYFNAHRDKEFLRGMLNEDFSLEEKVLFYTALETEQNRYMHQVKLPLVPESAWNRIADRLATLLPADVTVQTECQVPFVHNGIDAFWAVGIADAIKDQTVYELKFVDELAHKHFLQCAMYMICMNLDKGILWNVRTNQRFEIRIPNQKAFMDKVAIAVTKGEFTENESVTAGSQQPERAAFDYKEVFAKFVDDNPAACKKVLRRTEAAAKAHIPFGAVSIERAFLELGVEIPLVPKTFLRHWKTYCAEKKKKKSTKKSA